MPFSDYRTCLFEQLARIGKAVASPNRLALLDILAQGERSVEVLAREVGMSVANTSHHLQAIRDAGLVESRREGLHIYYRLADADVHELCRVIGRLAERRLAEMDRLIDRYLASRDRLEAVRREELLERVRGGEVVVLDVRPPDEYRAGHLPGAVSIPLEELECRLVELPPGVEVVAYCRGPYCLMAFEAVRLLRSKGRAARRLEDGLPEWRAAGLPVEA